MNLSNEVVTHVKSKNTEYIQFKKLLEYQDIITHAFSVGKQVDFRTLKRTNYDKAVQDYENLCTSLNLDKNNIIKPNQVHKDKIEIVKEKTYQGKPDIYLEQYSNVDGLITQKENLILSTTSADCILMLFFDPVTRTIANIHSGWKGTYQQIGVKTVQKLQKEFGVKPENLICCMCPSIRKCHFEVEKDVKDMFAERFREEIDLSRIIERKEGTEEKWNIDTVLLNTILLQKQGLKPENIIDSKICTVCNSQILHSYRAEKQGFGLETAIIALKGKERS